MYVHNVETGPHCINRQLLIIHVSSVHIYIYVMYRCETVGCVCVFKIMDCVYLMSTNLGPPKHFRFWNYLDSNLKKREVGIKFG